MKRIMAAGFCALAMLAGGAYAQSAQSEYDSGHSKYDSHSFEGNSANWGVGT
jgi:hypothetical protein